MIRILIADTSDDFLVSQVFMKMFKFESDLEGIGMIYLFDDNIIQNITTANPDVFIANIGAYNAANEGVIELVSRIVYEIAPCPVIVCAINDSADTLREYMLAGVVNYLLSPVSMDDLINSVRTAYNNSQRPPIKH